MITSKKKKKKELVSVEVERERESWSRKREQFFFSPSRFSSLHSPVERKERSSSNHLLVSSLFSSPTKAGRERAYTAQGPGGREAAWCKAEAIESAR